MTPFHNQVTYPTGTQPFGVTVADFNLDNKVNIAVANYGDSVISVHFNAGNGTFRSQVIYETGRQPVHVTVSDLNGDSIPDIIVANSGSNNIDILLHR
ncbi:unnamed protein product [Adineta ricciae]|uniref:VCBS repeat-containing protein n=1 Tax=Adineta ricciae TaxID=249248 RepID=A0A815PJ00_ADIRI|nr:unnamed protein product [Adineta ricciae]CAF1457279.1 unnamed protein product [Adineta ricciae]